MGRPKSFNWLQRLLRAAAPFMFQPDARPPAKHAGADVSYSCTRERHEEEQPEEKQDGAELVKQGATEPASHRMRGLRSSRG